MRLTLLVVALCSAAAQLLAQRDSLVGPGDRVWVRHRLSSGALDRGVKGTVEEVRRDTLLVRPTLGGSLFPVWSAEDSQLLVFAGWKSAKGRGGARGLLIGAGAGGAVGLAACQSDAIVQGGPVGCAAGAGLLGGLAGLVIGLAVGASSSTEVWKPATGHPAFYRPPSPYFTVQGSGKLRFGVSIDF